MSSSRAARQHVGPLPVSQDRSRQTVDRLLSATEAVMARETLDKVTVPAIAAEAGLSVGVVYKRFPDKDGLLRAVYERFFENSAAANTAALEPERWAGRSATEIVEMLVPGMVRGYVMHRHLLASLLLFGETHPDARFRDRTESLRREAFRGIRTLLMNHSDEIGHSQPEAAIDFALLLLALALRGIVLADRQRDYTLIRTEAQLSVELTRVVIEYLGLSPRTTSLRRKPKPRR